MLGRIRNFLRKNSAEQALDAELQSCVELLAEERMRRGIAPAEARRQALVELGGMAQVKEEVRDVVGLPLLEAAWRDVRFAVRHLARSPGFSITVILTLGLALGANSAVFALLDKVVLRPLPVKDPGALVIVSAPPIPNLGPPTLHNGSRISISGRPQFTSGTLSYPLYSALRDRLTVFDGALAEMNLSLMEESVTVLAGGEPVAVKGVSASGNYFQVLGIQAALGRVFTARDEALPGSSPVVVITDGFWRRQFGGDPSILNRTIRLNRFPMTVIGVTPPGFTGTVAGEAPDIIVPLSMRDSFMRSPFKYDSADMNVYKVMVRLSPGVSLQQAEKAADLLYRQLVEAALGEASNWSESLRQRLGSQHLSLLPGGYALNDQSALGRDLKTPLALLMTLVGLVLVVAAGNVANLFLARGEARSPEIAIRLALGSTRWRVLRQYLFESLMLSSAAAVCGLLFARFSAGLAPVVFNVERLPDGVTSAPDYRAGAVTLGLALLTGAGVWAASAFQASRQWGSRALAENVKSARQPRTSHWRRVLLTAQVSLSLMLLCTSAVLSRSLVRLMSLDPGFAVDRLYSFSLNPTQAGYAGSSAISYLDRVVDQLGRMPGATAVSVTNSLPFSSEYSGSVAEGARPPADAGPQLVARIGAGYFACLGMPLVAGREFTRDEAAGGAQVAVLNESLGRRLFGESNPIGRIVDAEGEPGMRVVGVVKDVKEGSRAPVRTSLFRAYGSQPGIGGTVTVVLRAARAGSISGEAVRAAVRRIDPSVAVGDFSSMTDRISRLLYRDRMLAFLSTCVAALAALLCGIGIFGLSAFSAQRRTQEIGIRIALGATRGSIEWLVMREISWLAAFGCAAGLAAFLASNQILSSVLFELTPSDPASVTVAATVLGGTVLLAGFLPAYRAARLDPARTLRRE